MLFGAAATDSAHAPEPAEIVTQQNLTAARPPPRFDRVLLAEDKTVNQKVARRFLENLGYTVDVVVNGREAVEAWRTRRYSLILMDCQMPDVDGYEATREIRQAERAGEHVPIVALTAHAMKGADLECRAAGMDDYLTTIYRSPSIAKRWPPPGTPSRRRERPEDRLGFALQSRLSPPDPSRRVRV